MRGAGDEGGGRPVGAFGRGCDQQLLRRCQAPHLVEEPDQCLAAVLSGSCAPQPHARGDDLGEDIGEAARQLLQIERFERRGSGYQVDGDGIKHRRAISRCA
ncbi:hypothetical protein ABIB00_004121 [Bradyrhizobium sp. LB14.3]|uniref:hypothetical protein n=1 Tax=Bradyrhizobium sp. LB14.3 TaxID=3156328 RepID=UPI00339421D6